MVIGDLLNEAVSHLKNQNIENPRLDAEVLLAHILKKDRVYLAVHRNSQVPQEQAEAFRKLYQRRGTKEPVAYIVGHREFMSLDFDLLPGILIPRPDTEVLVEFVMEACPNAANISDLCTGSGAIAVSLAHYLPQSHITAVDISPLCVEITQKNAEKNGVADRVEVLEADILAWAPDRIFDCIVSNPPYIPTEVVMGLDSDVKDYEPHLALDGGKDGLVFYRHLAQKAHQWLCNGGVLAMEIGHDQADEVAALLKETGAFSHIGFCRDLAGIRRVVYGKV